jgi:hypothetical protein
MVTGSDGTASAQQRQEAKSPRRKQSVKLIKLLQLIAREHKVCYEIWPVWSISDGVRTPAGFEVLLCGVNGHLRREKGVLHPVAGCQHCARSYAELREIAEWIVPLRKPPFSYTIYSFDHALHVAPPNRQHRSEIIITTAMFDEAYHNQPDHCESECLKEVRERLYNLGIREDSWHAAASGNA